MKNGAGTRVISVPWPVRLFGDLHDALGLPSVVAACDLRTAVSASPRRDERYSILGPGSIERVEFDPFEEPEKLAHAPALRHALLALRSLDLPERRGWDFELHSRVPGIEEMTDAPALCVAWTVMLLALQDRLKDLSGNEVAELTLSARQPESPVAQCAPEVYAAVLGGTLLVKPEGPEKALPIMCALPGLVLAYLPDAAAPGAREVNRALGELTAALQRLEAIADDYDPRESPFDVVIPLLRRLSDRDARLVYAQTLLRDFCAQALDALETELELDDDLIGEILDGCHEMLSEHLGLGSADMQPLIEAARGAGALGCKIIPGSAGLIIFGADRAEEIMKTVRGVGGEARLAPVAEGMRIET